MQFSPQRGNEMESASSDDMAPLAPALRAEPLGDAIKRPPVRISLPNAKRPDRISGRVFLSKNHQKVQNRAKNTKKYTIYRFDSFLLQLIIHTETIFSSPVPTIPALSNSFFIVFSHSSFDTDLLVEELNS